MNYEEKSELKEEITTSTKRSIKHCIIAGLGTVGMEVLIWGFLYQILNEHMSLELIFCAGIVLLGLRYLQGGLIAWFSSE